ncbi:hypothetical protein Lfu02_80040 [Longispora fulva]|uniref:Terminase small subunit n=1 Tax=Longispora fulva TaxID=619741 RepID=A0A8J7KMM5_9ACTN|nr:hypothetical protein [Longispora fulva]MBG6140674.1 hypothetical protein [Longispora fulva]GIG63632.1 hypothetical protein Lfu02_80040 [Longispora fulva]
MPATRGPVPKRSDQRRRRNAGEPVTSITPAAEPVDAPPLGFPAHELAADWYSSLAESGQSQYFEPSDWQAARLLAYDLTRHLNSGRVSAQMLAAVWSAMGDLLTTEAARRRVRMEIERDQGDEDLAGVTALDEYRRALGAG